MNTKVILLIVLSIGIAAVKVFYKQDKGEDQSGDYGESGSRDYTGPKDVLKSLEGAWIARRDKTSLSISVQGRALTLKNDTLEKTIKIRDVDSTGIIFDGPDYIGIEFYHSSDAIIIIYDLPGTRLTQTDYYDRADNG